MEGINLTWGRNSRLLLYFAAAFIAVLIVAAIGTPNLLRSRMAASSASQRAASPQALASYNSAQMKAVDSASPAIGGEPRAADAAAALDRKVIRKGTMEVIVDNPAAALDEISTIARDNHGYVVSSELTGRQESQRGNIMIRVPAAQFDTARAGLKKLAKRVESEQTTADDVTMQYAENEATLRNFRAEEASYLQIMQRSGSIRDTLTVAQQLSNVRGRIERLEAEIRTMSMQSEMTAIQVSVTAEPVAAAPQRWRPLYELQAAWNDGLDALAAYATAMMSILLYLPAVLAWMITIAVGAKLCWMLLRFGRRFFFGSRPAATVS